MAILKEKQPNISWVLQAVRELEKLPEVQAYIALQKSLEDRPWPSQTHRD